MFNKVSSSKGFTLIELMVVIAIVGLLASAVLASMAGAKDSALDARRLVDMRSIRMAFEEFYADNGRYPGPLDGVPRTGQIIGDGLAIDAILEQYLDTVPRDPLHDGTIYFYGYDPYHCMTDPAQPGPCNCDAPPAAVYGFNKANGSPSGLQNATCSGGNLNLHNADYSVAITPAS